MEYEIRFYYPKNEYSNKFKLLKSFKELNYCGRYYEVTTQFDHPCKEYSFYTKKVDGRFRIRRTEGNNNSKCMISWKRRLNKDKTDINKEEEIEVAINPKEYDNLMFLVNNVLHLKLVERYERYRTTFKNDDVEIVLDEYPFGLALEIEAKNKNKNPNLIIDNYMKLLNLNYKDSYKLSWDDKYEELCSEQHIEKYNEITFDKDMPQIK